MIPPHARRVIPLRAFNLFTRKNNFTSTCCNTASHGPLSNSTSRNIEIKNKHPSILFRSSSSLHKRATAALSKNQKPLKSKISNGKKIQSKNVDDANPIPSQVSVEEASDESAEFETPSPSFPSLSSLPPQPAIQGHLHEFAPRIAVVGIGGAGGNAVNNMIARSLSGVDFLTLNTDAQHLSTTLTDNRLQIGQVLTGGLGCGANPDAGRLAAEESREEILERIGDAHMVFITAGMGGGTGTGAAPVVAELCYDANILTVAVVTKPFRFEGSHRMRLAEEGLERLRDVVDTLIVIPNQNLFEMVTEETSLMDAFAFADDVLLAGVRSITDLMTQPGLINLDFADVQSVMHGMGNAMLGTGEDDGPDRAITAATKALTNPLLGNMDISTSKGMLVNITGGSDMTLFEVDKAAQQVTDRIEDKSANVIFGSAYDQSMDGKIRVSVVATGIEERIPIVIKQNESS